MKRTFFLLLVLIFIFSGCKINENQEYILEYKTGDSNYIISSDDDGVFYVIDNHITMDFSKEKIEILSGYFNGSFLNFNIRVYTNEPNVLEEKANDDGKTLYPIVSIKEEILTRVGYGYRRLDIVDKDYLACYELNVSYEHPENHINHDIHVDFLGNDFNLSMIKKQAVLLSGNEGKLILSKYEN